ncbi:MAG: HDOD domain-containing protein [Spirochaetales bacterium]|nr:HDOD domain-containing protein [Spirochaetales bacterium]
MSAVTAGYEQYLKNLPVIPAVAAKILSMAEEKLEISFKKLEDLIKTDPGLTAKILKIANSALYARQREIKSLQTAITLLGFKNIKSLVILITASNTFSRLAAEKFYTFFWRHSLLSAFFARHIALRSGKKELSEECFIAGLLHDIGQVAFFHTDPERYRQVVAQLLEGKPGSEGLEEMLFGFTHRTFGAVLLQKWSFPEVYVDAAREHKSLNVTSPYKTVVLIVTAAALFAELSRIGSLDEESQSLLTQILPRIGLASADSEYYRVQFLADLHNDPLYRECGSLFGL